MNIKNYNEKTKRFFFSIIIIIMTSNCFADNNNYRIKDVISSPEAASFAQYVSVPVSHYTGVPEINIPIYTISLNGFRYPITLSYHASGIKVSQEASSVGLGWLLKAGGVITRSVRGWDDELNVRSGFAYRYPDYPKTDADIYENINKYFSFDLNTEYYSPIMDVEPDIFFYNFGEYQGQFILDKNNDKVYGKLFNPEDNLKIEITDEKYFLVTTPTDGVKYEFRSTEYARTLHMLKQGADRDMFSNSDIEYEKDASIRIYWSPENRGTWYLSKIILPNANTIEFAYTAASYESPLFVYGNYCQHLGTYSDVIDINHPDLIWLKYPESDNFPYNITLNKEVILNALQLESIKWKYGELTFHTSERFDVKAAELQRGKLKKTDKVELKDNAGNVVSTYLFKTSYFRPDKLYDKDKHLFLRLRLDSLLVNGNDASENKPLSYKFTYKSRYNLPAKNGHCDIWGYARTRSTSLNYESDDYLSTPPLVVNKEDIYYFPNGVPTLLERKGNYAGEEKRLCDSLHVDTYMLETIKYPTGGSTFFFYEPHSTTDFTFEDSTIGNGVRIKRIVNAAVDRTFEYTTNYGLSTGTMHNKPKMFDYTVTMKPLVSNTPSPFSPLKLPVYYVFKTVSNVNLNSLESKVGYSMVAEYQQKGNEKTKVEYYFANATEYNQECEEMPCQPDKYNGKIEKEIYYETVNKESNIYRKKKQILYNYGMKRYADVIKIMRLRPALTLKSSDPISLYNLKFNYYEIGNISEDEYIYDKNTIRTLKKTRIFSYSDDNFQIKSESMRNNNEHSIYKKYRYSDEVNSPDYISMKNNHIIKPVEETTEYNGKIVSSNLSTYKKNGSLYTLSNLYTLNKKDIPNSTFVQFNGLINANYYPVVKYNKYDSAGNLIEAENKDNVTTAYIWGYNYQYPIAEVVNATRSEIEYALGTANTDGLCWSPMLSETQVKDLQNLRTKLPHAIVTTCTYKPLVGMTSKTDPRGITTYYDYDGFGRLKRAYIIENGTQKNIQTYDYYYKP